MAKRKPPPAVSHNRHHQRTVLTRENLLAAAAKIFARDGFELAKLEEIAAEAGYTRGALYANFTGKEDLFIALLSAEVEKRMSRARMLPQAANTFNPLWLAMRENYVRSLRDRTWNVLFLEYKLFILRHPEFKFRISEMQARVFAVTEAALDEINSSVGMKLPVSSLAAATALSALATTLGIDLLIDKSITADDVDTILGLFFDALVGPGSGAS